MTEPFKIDLYDEKGKLKSKEAFLKDMENLYGQLGGKKDDMTFMDLFTNPESAFSPDDVLDKYQFIERKLYVDAEINPEMSQYILERIQFWNAEDEFDETPIEERIPIQVYINSPGGCLVSTLQIVDAIRNSKSPVYTIATGAAYSGGFFILLAGHKKMAYPNASFLFHEGSFSIKESDIDRLCSYANDKLKDIDFNEGFYEADFVVQGNYSEITNLVMDIGSQSKLWGQTNDEPVIIIENITIPKAQIQMIGSKKDTVKFVFNGMTYMIFKAQDIIDKIFETTGDTLNITCAGRANINTWGNKTTPQIYIDEIEIKESSIYDF